MARPHSRPAISEAPTSRAADTSGHRPLLVSLLVSLRPGQWTKNLIVFAGLVFSLKLFEPRAILTAIEAFVIFCALSGIVYLINDVMDGAGVLFDDKQPANVAALMNAILSDPDLQDDIVEGQLAAVDRLQAKDFDGTLLGFVDQILQAPRQGAPRVAFDFWHQFDASEELEEIRMYRPGAFKALPERPA